MASDGNHNQQLAFWTKHRRKKKTLPGTAFLVSCQFFACTCISCVQILFLSFMIIIIFVSNIYLFYIYLYFLNLIKIFLAYILVFWYQFSIILAHYFIYIKMTLKQFLKNDLPKKSLRQLEDMFISYVVCVKIFLDKNLLYHNYFTKYVRSRNFFSSKSLCNR